VFQENNPRILLVDDDPAMLRLLSRWLDGHGYELRTACDGKNALEVINDWQPDILVTDLEMPRVNGIELCKRLRNRCTDGYVYTIMLTVKSGSADIVQALEAGADDFLKKPVDRDELIARLRAGLRVLELENRLNLLSRLDPLTSLASHRTLLERIQQEFARSARHYSPLTAVIVDIDDLKQVNENHGHAVGDEILRKLGRLIQRNSRANDLVARFSGKQFCVLLTETEEHDALIWAERMRQLVDSFEYQTESEVIRTTVSIGIAGRTSDTQTPDELLDLAKNALLTSKSLGRNRVVNHLSIQEDGNSSLTGEISAIDGLLAKDVMSHIFATLNQNDTAAAAANFFLESRCHSSPVVDDDGKLVGVLGQKDLLAITLWPNWRDTPIHKLMKKRVVTYEEDSLAIQIYDFVSRSAMRSVVIVKDGKPTGMFGRDSLLQWFVNHQQATLNNIQPDSGTRQRILSIASQLHAEAEKLAGALRTEPAEMQVRIVDGASRMQQGISDLLVHTRELSPHAGDAAVGFGQITG
jgi:two-component system cell cycle response regulator